MKKINWNEVEESNGQPTKGGYILKIIAIDDDEQREFLKVYMDIDEGEYAGYFGDLYDRFGFYGLTHIRSYKETAKGLFKKFLKCLEESNQGFVADAFDNDPQKLLGLRIGGVLQLRRYTKQNGLDGTQLRVPTICSIEDIRTGKFTVPEDLDERESAQAPPVTPSSDGFVDVPADADEEGGLPFH